MRQKSINSIKPPMNDKLSPKIFSVFGHQMPQSVACALLNIFARPQSSFSLLPRLAAPKQLPLDCLFFFEQIVAVADDIVAAQSPTRSAPLPGSLSQAI